MTPLFNYHQSSSHFTFSSLFSLSVLNPYRSKLQPFDSNPVQAIKSFTISVFFVPPMSVNFRNQQSHDLITLATSQAAKSFVTSFYAMLDSDRTSLPTVFRPDLSTMVWDGNNIEMSKLLEFLNHTPLTRHNILSIDAHPVLLQDQDSDHTHMFPTPTILVTIQGDLNYGTSNFKQGFIHTLVLKKATTEPQDRIYYCQTFNVRLHKTPLAIPVSEQPHHQNRRR